jgi:L-seryl-tRNA(Ser) seleniumtransferase
MAELRKLPKVDALAQSPALEGFSHDVRVRAARAAIAALRTEALSGNGADFSRAEALAALEAVKLGRSGIRRTINASGVILHTGLGRARLPELAAKRLFEVASSHAAVELDLDSGERGDRQTHVRGLLAELSGAEDAYVVNNCAAAIFLSLAALCKGKKVVLSRGEMVEIGGQFRMPDIVRESGCELVEVGCTNKTRLSDYAEAIDDETAAILRCHPSNYRIVGFTDSPSGAELRHLAEDRGVLFLHDLGGGCLFDTTQFGLPRETTLREAVAEGADVVTCSADKLLGGPQGGLLLGKREALARIARHPLARAFRVDKLTLAALEATLTLHREGRLEAIPTHRAMSRPLDEVRRAARRIADAFAGRATVEEGLTEVGGGSLPGAGIPTWRTGLETNDPEQLARSLRMGDPAILGRIERGKVWLDPRTIEPFEMKEVLAALRGLGPNAD